MCICALYSCEIIIVVKVLKKSTAELFGIICIVRYIKETFISYGIVNNIHYLPT